MNFTDGTIELKGQRVEARTDDTGTVSYLSSGKWRAASAKAAATFTPAQLVVPGCKKDPSHEWRVTKSGGYCYTEDRIVAERQKAERAAAKAASA